MKVMAFLVLMALGLAMAAQSIVYLNFKLNQDVIAKELCVEREVVNSCCKGSCYLEKQLDNLDQQPESTSKKSDLPKEKFELASFVLPTMVLASAPTCTYSFFNYPTPFNYGAEVGFSFCVWHPPTQKA